MFVAERFRAPLCDTGKACYEIRGRIANDPLPTASAKGRLLRQDGEGVGKFLSGVAQWVFGGDEAAGNGGIFGL